MTDNHAKFNKNFILLYIVQVNGCVRDTLEVFA